MMHADMVIQQYQDPSVTRWLKFGFWYQEHKAALAKILVGGLIGANALFWAYTLYGMGTLVVSSRSDDEWHAELAAMPADIAAIHASHAPLPLAVHEVWAVPSASEPDSFAAVRADFLALVENPNPDWIMRINYAFQWEGGQTESREKIVLPESETYLAILGAPVAGAPADAELLSDIAWERVRDPSKLVRPALALGGISAETAKVALRAHATDVRVVIQNQSQYTVIAPSLLLVATSFSGEPIAAWEHVGTIASGGEITSERRFLRVLPSSLEVAVYPDFELFDDGAYQLRGSDFIPF